MKKTSPDQTARHKHFLRLHYRESARALSFAKRRSAASAVARRVAGLAEFRGASVVGVFLSLPFEVDTSPLIALARQAGKIVAVPVVFPEAGRLQFAVLPSGRPRLIKNAYGISEPARKEWVDRLDLVIVPGAAFTPRGDRLGAGAGYYDRFLDRRSGPKSVGICFDEQVAVRLPHAAHDKQVDAVATPSRTHRARV